MRTLLAPLTLLAMAIPLSATSTATGDEFSEWPNWLGPNLDAISTETDWKSEGKKEDAWRFEAGYGYSSVILSGGRLYTKGYDKDGGMDVIWCLDATTGEEIWATAYEAELLDLYHTGGTLSTPTLDGDTLYVLNRDGKLHAMEAATGEILWDLDLADKYDLEKPTWGFGASPLVAGDNLIINVGKTLSVSKENGTLVWKSKEYGHAYSTPRAFEQGGKHYLAVFNSNGLAILSQKDGEEAAFFGWKTQYDVNSATPIMTPDGGIFITSGYGHGCAVLDFADGKITPRWENKSLQNQMSGPVLIDGHLYGFDDAELVCISLKDGEKRWTHRELDKGSLMATTDGRLIVIGGKGKFTIAKASPEGFTPESQVDLFDAGVCWTRPVLVDGRIYVRNSFGDLVCRDHR